jgi:phosphoglycolate phosphatase-like HAD superfamily hydrolase
MAIVFDYDGVLVDARQDNIEALNLLAPKYGFTPFTFETYCEMNKENFYQYWDAKLGDRAAAFYKDLHALPRQKAHLLPGMREILLEHKPAIVSSNFTILIQRTLAENNVALEVFGGEQESSKTKKLLRLKHAPDIFVTDTAGDILEGREAGYIIIAVTWGYNNFETIIKAKPHYVVHSPQQLQRKLEKLRGAIEVLS